MIRNACLEAVFYPTAGGRMGCLRHFHYGHLLVPFPGSRLGLSQWPKAGAFPLFPFHNKLQSATFNLEGRQIRLKPNMTDGTTVMHGPAHRRAWHVSDNTEQHIELALDYKADQDWPFDFRATQRFELCRNQLTIALRLTNTGKVVMPGGIGWHPYFRASESGQISLDAERQWDPFTANRSFKLARGNDVAPSPILELGRTHHYSGWKQATASIGDGARIAIEGHDALSYFAALHKEVYLCLEPVSHLAGAFSDIDGPFSNNGLRLLVPGESCSGTAILSVS
ncbi:hypothetical protein [Qingshengfaniella alkalisoli]|uniref:aldose epimerase family protein n=1 Tax=Qingshengfaniella alkalisoli TaxID=2599296 RepID=UPI00197C6A82|nr:hypothetical protein [Qingshengfaniella alkalisoli]